MFSKKFYIRVALFLFSITMVSGLSLYIAVQVVKSSLPKIITVKDYEPLLVSQVVDRNNVKVGEFFRERRTLVPFEKMPKDLIHAFLAAEDDGFYEHGGINYSAIIRAFLANLRAGHTVQGASTITQQVAKTLILQTAEKTLLRKVREAMLAFQIEANLSKDDILYLYLNQIYFGQSAYGVELASQTYFKKSVENLTLPEMAILAGLPKAPSAYSPVTNPHRAKERQVYVLNRMADVGFITAAQAESAKQTPVKVFVKEDYEINAPYYMETIRQMLIAKLGENVVLDQGIKIYASLDLKAQKAAQEAVVQGLKSLDKRQGFRGALRTISDEEAALKFLNDQKKKLIWSSTPERIILTNGTFADIELVDPKLKIKKTRSNLPPFIKVGETIQGIIQEVNDSLGLVYVQLPDAQAVIDFETMKWARKPDANKSYDTAQIKLPSEALKKGDVVFVKVAADQAAIIRTVDKKTKVPPLPDLSKFAAVELDQEPIAEASLISYDQQTQDVLALVGGYSFARNEYNRALQAARQTGSGFKAIVYASALDKGFTPSSTIMDAPVVFEDQNKSDEGQGESKTWKPENHGNSFGGEITFRNALVKSKNIPSVKIIEDVGVPWSIDYAKRLGIFSPLNPDFTLVLGSSSVTLYEMTKVFAQFGRLGKRLRPLLIHRVEDKTGKVLLKDVSLDLRFETEIGTIDEGFQKRREQFLATSTAEGETPNEQNNNSANKNFFFNDPEQLIKPQTAYIMTSLLKGVVEDSYGTGGRARALGREVAGKTGSTNGYYDAWFIGYTAQISTGVWVGFDKERSLGKEEVGGRAALPIWVDYMKAAHENLPLMTFPVPEGIVVANLDRDSGKLPTSATKQIIKQAFAEGTEPSSSVDKSEETEDFYKQDLSE